MLKPLASLATGDWVVLSSVITSRFISNPWRVTAISKSRVYLERDDPAGTEKTFSSLKSVKFVFTDRVTAQAAADFAKANSEAYLKSVRERAQQAAASFDVYMQKLALEQKPSTVADSTKLSAD